MGNSQQKEGDKAKSNSSKTQQQALSGYELMEQKLELELAES